MLVNGYHTTSQLITCEWIGHFGHKPENIARWPGFNQNLPPPELPADFPEDWQVAAGELPARPGVHHWVFDAPNGNELNAPGPLI